MNNREFDKTMDLIAELWPRKGASLNREQRNIYWISIGKYSAEAVQAAVRTHMANSPYFPKPADLRKISALFAKEPEKRDELEQEKHAEWVKHCNEVRRERADIDNSLIGVTTREMEKHRDAVIRANPSLAWIKNIPIESQIIRVFVADRINHGLRDDFDRGISHSRDSWEAVEIDRYAKIDNATPDPLYSSVAAPPVPRNTTPEPYKPPPPAPPVDKEPIF